MKAHARRARAARLFATAGAAASLGACSLTFNWGVEQCAVDDDCAALGPGFEGSFCSQGRCERPDDDPGGRAGGAPAGAGGRGGAPAANGAGGAGGGASAAFDPIDHGFGDDGFVRLERLSMSLSFTSFALGPAGRINLLFTAQSSLVMRLLEDGAADPDFGADGAVEITGVSGLRALAARADGKLVMGGDEYRATNSGLTFRRLRADGSPDASFGEGGTALVTLGDDDDANLVALALHGEQTLAVGTGGPYGQLSVRPGAPADGFNTAPDALALRLGPDGALDAGFDAPAGYHFYDGRPEAEGNLEFGLAALARDDGSLYSCGTGWNAARPPADQSFDLLILRYRPDGELDPGFGQGGVVYFERPAADGAIRLRDESCFAMAEAPGGKLVVVGEVANREYFDVGAFLVARFLPDGTPDPTFGEGGAFVFAPHGWNRLTGVVALPDGSLVAAGFGGRYDEAKPAFLRLGPGGAPDPSFGENGLYELDVPNAHESPLLLARTPGGKLLAAGTAPRPFLVRLNAP